MKGFLYVIAAPSGAGKTSLVQALAKKESHIEVSISHTTRPMRAAEQHGVDYYFISEQEFLAMVANHEFLEYARVHDHYYGTSKTYVEDKLSQGIDVILEIDWQGAQQIRQTFQETISIFILPPTFASLETRLRQRGQDNETIIQQRLQNAHEELKHYTEFDYLIVNQNFDQAIEELHCILTAERLQISRAQLQQAPLLAALLKTQ